MQKPLIYENLDLSDRFLITDSGEIISRRSGKALKTRINPHGYEEVCISLGKRGKNKLLKIHRAVAFNYVDGYKQGLVVNHKDCNKLNNNASNLEWVTSKENSVHALRKGLYSQCKRVMCAETKQIFDSIKDASEWCGLKSANSLEEYFKLGTRKTAGKHPVTKQRLTWVLV